MHASPWIQRSLGLLLLIAISACQDMEPAPFELESYLSQQGGTLATVLAEPETFRVQISYVQIDRDQMGVPHFTPYSYRLSPDAYFYPASTVKLPAALLSLQKLALLHQEGLTRETPMLTDSLARIAATNTDSTSASGYPSIGHYVRKIFLVSDNDAFNRLYEFLGQGPLNGELSRMGFEDIRLTHRLSIFMSQAENSHTNAVRFGVNGEVYEQPDRINQDSFAWPAPILLGQGELQGDQMIKGPKDFTYKNHFPLLQQQEVLRRFIFPEAFPSREQFIMADDDRAFALKAMAELPRESKFPAYPDTSYYYDSFCKFFMFGDQKTPIPDHIRIFNKIGVAYGFSTDNAYIVDFDHQIEFMLAATIYTNENGIFNDGQYEYETIAWPFLAELGRALYQRELKRPRTYAPQLDEWQGLFVEP